MKLKTLAIMIAATTAAFTACTENDSQQQQMMPITLTTNIAPTRGVQDTQIASGQTLYVWAKTEDGGTADWTSGDCYIEAWQLTAGSEGALTSANGTTYYYPPQSLSMIALHGNFSFTEGQTPFPAIVSHSVLSDQSTAGNLEQSDLLWCRQNGCTAANNPQSVTLGHKLSKIEITLSSSIYTNAEIDQMTVTLNNVLPTVDLTLSTGNTGAAHGNTIAVTPRRTATATENSGKAVFEAVIPAQTRPSEFITVRLNGGVVSVDAQVTEFEANKRYPYTLDMTYRDVRKNPLWYVAEYNVNYDGAGNYSWATTPDEGYFFRWADALTAARQFDGWRLPSRYDFNSILPGTDTTINPDPTSETEATNAGVDIFKIASTDGTGAVFSNNALLSFGYNEATMGKNGYMTEKSYWYRVNENLVYAIRYCDTEFCSAWKYEWAANGLSVANPATFTITSVLLGVSLSTDEAQVQFGTTQSNWTAVFNGLQFNSNGCDVCHGAVTRVFVPKGYANGNDFNPRANTGPGQHGQYWLGTDYGVSARSALFAFSCGGEVNIRDGDQYLARPIRLFRKSGYDIRRNPLWYMARLNINSDLTFNKTMSTSQGYAWEWSNLMTKGFTYNTTGYDGYALPSTPKTVSNGEAGVTWHVPTMMELSSVIPGTGPYNSTAQNLFSNTYMQSGLNTEDACTFGYNNDTKYGVGKTSNPATPVGTQFQSYWSSYTSNSNVRYAIRFLGSNYCSIWKYQYLDDNTTSARLVISSRLIEPVSSSDNLSAILNSYMAKEDAFWLDDESVGAVQRILYACGYNSGSQANCPGDLSPNILGIYWTSKNYSEAYAYSFQFQNNNMSTFYNGLKTSCRPVRLFRDN